MPEGQSLIPEITDHDIDWVRGLMRLDALDPPRRAFLTASHTLDVAACPGSGKTTLIVAKLAILSKKWPHRSKGICVLSHTNVAREEIQRRLGSTGVGQRLLGYPHFIDTIHRDRRKRYFVSTHGGLRAIARGRLRLKAGCGLVPSGILYRVGARCDARHHHECPHCSIINRLIRSTSSGRFSFRYRIRRRV